MDREISEISLDGESSLGTVRNLKDPSGKELLKSAFRLASESDIRSLTKC